MSRVPLQVMVVDDSAIVRKLVADALADLSAVRVVATAPNGRIALLKIAQDPPDVCIIDLEMPEMDGAELLGHLRADHPTTRVVVITSNSALARSRAVQALMAGADDILLKPRFEGGSYAERAAAFHDLLLPKLLQFVPPASPNDARAQTAARMSGLPGPGLQVEALVMGVSTGGPEALARLFAGLPADLPWPVLIVQHMPEGFTAALAERLNRLSVLDVAEARDGEPLVAGRVLIAPGGRHLSVAREEGGRAIARVSDGPPENSCRPSVDVLFRSAANLYGEAVLGLVLTGMGSDGTRGAEAIKAQGGRVIAQDRDSSVVWGMPGSVVQAGVADEVVALEGLAPRLVAIAARRVGRAG